MGPGTHIITRLLNRVKPINRVDAAAMIHDIEYLNPFISEYQADANALENAGHDFNPLKYVMRIGFTLKNIAGGYKSPTNITQYLLARSLVSNHYQDILKKYNLKFIDFKADSK